MINLEKFKQEKCRPSPVLRRPTPAPYFHPLFLIPPFWGRHLKFTPPPPTPTFKKKKDGLGGGGRAMTLHLRAFNVHRSRDSKHSTVPYRTLKQMIFWECSENYKSIIFQKPLWMVTLSCQVIFLLNQCHSMAEKSGGQTMGKNTGKSDFFVLFQQF